MTPRHKEDKPLSPTPNDTIIRQEDAGIGGPLLPDTFQSGVLESWLPGTFTAMVALGGPSPRTVPATWFAGVMASAHFGLTVSFQPEVGTSVKLVKDAATDTFWIIGAFQEGNGAGFNRSDAGLPETLLNRDTPLSELLKGVGTQQRGNFAQRRNRVGGEMDSLNAADVGVQFLRNLVRMKASDLAYIECNLLDDLVRIVSENYQHVSALGDYRIVNDGGRPTAIWKGSSKWYETMGQESPKAILELGTDDPFVRGARSRFQKYLGHLGNIFHFFVSDPLNTLGEFAAGRFRAHVNEDGSFLMQTTGDLIFEKAVRIQVPAEQFTADDPEGDHLIDQEWTESPELQTWSPADTENLYYEAYKLRDYARWMNNWFSLAQYHRSRKDYKVPKETEVPTPAPDGVDPERPNQDSKEAQAAYLTRYATIRIYRDGSVFLMDGYNSTVHMGGGDVTLSAARHLRLEAAGDILLTSGRDIIATAYRHLDLGSLVGGLTLRGRRWIRGLCDGGRILLEQQRGEASNEEGETDDTPGIQVRSLDGDLALSGYRNLLLSSYQGIIIKGLYVAHHALRVVHKFGKKVYALFGPSRTVLNTNVVNTAGILQAAQLQVRIAVPVPVGSQPESLVLVNTESDPDADITDSLLGDLIDLETEPETPLQMQFRYDPDRDELVLPQSVTQAEITTDESIGMEELTITGTKEKVAKTHTTTMKVYQPSNNPMNEPSENTLKTTKSKPMRNRAWSFKRI